MATLTLRVPDALEDDLLRRSAELGVSKSDLAREALRRYLQVAELRSLRARLVPLAQSQGIHSDEDVFERIGR